MFCGKSFRYETLFEHILRDLTCDPDALNCKKTLLTAGFCVVYKHCHMLDLII